MNNLSQLKMQADVLQNQIDASEANIKQLKLKLSEVESLMASIPEEAE
jgi:prefoldin subunit 5